MTIEQTRISPAIPTESRELNADIDDPDVTKELRIAVTMNGGVSLAVYIGGVAHEFNRLTKVPPVDGNAAEAVKAPYARLLEAIGYNSPIIDVITGTSAGGINAAALALAQANTSSNFAALRDLWIDRGQISDLLREPFHSGAPSLLKGDDYLYPEIKNAFRELTKGHKRSTNAPLEDKKSGKPQAPKPRPVDLTITATLLSPVPATSVDDLGTKIEQPKHAGLFKFTSKAKRKGEKEEDMFAEFDDKKPPGSHSIVRTVEALALAARNRKLSRRFRTHLRPGELHRQSARRPAGYGRLCRSGMAGPPQPRK